MLPRVMAGLRRGELWHDADFRRLWLGETVSQVGGQITYLALPLAAALLLNATPTEMGVLSALVLLPYLVLAGAPPPRPAPGLAPGTGPDRAGRGRASDGCRGG